MTVIEGGLRDRLIHEGLHRLIEHILDSEGWLDPNPTVRQNVTLQAKPVDADEEVLPNRVAVTPEDSPASGLELGSTLAEYVHVFYIDVYGEDDAVGSHIAGDIRSGLEGKLAAAGRTTPTLDVFAPGDDPAVDPPAFVCDIEQVLKERVPRESPRPWERHWWTVRCEIVEDR